MYWKSVHTIRYDTKQGRNHVFKVGVQFLGLGYCTEQNTDGIPSFVVCSRLRNGNHTLHQKSWGGRPNFWGPDPSTPSGCALDTKCLQWAETLTCSQLNLRRTALSLLFSIGVTIHHAIVHCRGTCPLDFKQPTFSSLQSCTKWQRLCAVAYLKFTVLFRVVISYATNNFHVVLCPAIAADPGDASAVFNTFSPTVSMN